MVLLSLVHDFERNSLYLCFCISDVFLGSLDSFIPVLKLLGFALMLHHVLVHSLNNLWDQLGGLGLGLTQAIVREKFILIDQELVGIIKRVLSSEMVGC